MMAGIEIGGIARGLHAGGEYGRLPDDSEETAIQRTADLAVQRKPIYEAAMGGDGIYALADILVPNDDGWTLIEVKSSARLKPEHVQDVSFQALAASKCGIKITKFMVMLINRDYVLGDELIEAELMITEEITKDVREVVEVTERIVGEQIRLIQQDEEPQLYTGSFCNKPGRCGFYKRCHEGQSEKDLEFMPAFRQKKINELRDSGVFTIDEIPESTKMNPLQRRVKDVITFSRDYVDDSLANRLEAIKQPAACIDFETAQSAVPLFKGTRPYQQIPFQWSMHLLDGDNPAHSEFLCEDFIDPREGFTQTLLAALEGIDTILYYSPFEVQRAKELEEGGIPGGKELHDLLKEKGVDQLKVLKDCVYLEGFKGSFSIKKALPALAPDFGYDGLAIQDGDTAVTEYLKMISATDPAQKQTISDNLRAYCKMDTLAMVEVHRGLVRLSGG